jgi:hypothetical protein
MTDQERGAYTPQTDAPLAFDARRVRGASGGPAPVTLAVSLAVALLVLIAVLLFYRSGMRGAGQPPRVVGAPVTAPKVPAPADSAASAAPVVPVLKTEATPPSEPRGPNFAPAPEMPAPRPAPRTAAPPPPAASAALRPAQTEAPEPPPAAIPAATAPAPRAAPIKPVRAPPPAAPLARTATLSAPAAGEPVVQIGAFSSAALARKGWSDTAALMPGRMAGRTAKVEKADRDGKTFYRSYVGGFASKAQADGFCAALKAAGKSCIVR